MRVRFRNKDVYDELEVANRKLRDLAERDDVTGLYNMRFIYQKIEAELRRAKRYGDQVAAIMMDLDHFKSVNDVLDTYADRGYMTPEQAKAYQGRLETAASSPNASLASLQSAVPMPQIGDFRTPTGTPTPVTYTAPAQPITDKSAYINDLYKQLGANVSQGLLAVPQAQTLQSQLRQAYLNPQSTTEQLQGIYNTGMQQYKPLI